MKNYKKVWQSGITSNLARYTHNNVIDPSKETGCPQSYDFGYDCDEYVECDSCEVYKECKEKWISLNPPKKNAGGNLNCYGKIGGYAEPDNF